MTRNGIKDQNNENIIDESLDIIEHVDNKDDKLGLSWAKLSTILAS